MTTVEGMTQLRERIRTASETAGGYRALARLSNGLVSHSTLNNVANGRHSGRFDDDTIRGIAAAVGAQAREIAALAGVAYHAPLELFRLPDRANKLSGPQRRVVLSVVDAILTAGERVEQKTAEQPPARLRAVARKGTPGSNRGM